jgi:glycosyltransferase involved in cell wall biosynthesis
MVSELLQHAQAHLAAGQYEEAGAIATRYARSVDPLDPVPHFIASRAAHATGRWLLAMVEAANAIVLAPHNPTFRERFLAAIGRLAVLRSEPLIGPGARRLLDRLAEPAPAAQAKATGGVDLVLPMAGPYGSELNLIETARILRRHVPTRIWSDVPPHPQLLELDPTIRMIAADDLPSAESLIFMGIFAKPPGWLARSPARRIVLRYNVWQMLDLLRWLSATGQSQAERVDVIYASHALKAAVGDHGPVLHTFIDLEHFPAREPVTNISVVGRLSRDEVGKHHPQDPALYRQLLSWGMNVRIMGGTVLAPQLGQRAGLTLMPVLAAPASAFIRGLDLFYYRTGTFYESFGRVVMEAMASGVPVLCHRAGGYADIVRHGENGFLFEQTGEAAERIAQLRTDAGELRRIGEAGRATVEAMHTQECRDRLIAYYAGL